MQANKIRDRVMKTLESLGIRDITSMEAHWQQYNDLYLSVHKAMSKPGKASEADQAVLAELGRQRAEVTRIMVGKLAVGHTRRPQAQHNVQPADMLVKVEQTGSLATGKASSNVGEHVIEQNARDIPHGSFAVKQEHVDTHESAPKRKRA